MSNSNHTLIKIYNNLSKFFNYKQLKNLDETASEQTFIKHIYNNQYFTIKTVDNTYPKEDMDIINKNINNIGYINKKNYKITYFLIFHYNTDLYSKTQDLKKIIGTLKKNPFKYDIVLITKNNISTHVGNYIDSIKNIIHIINYTFKLVTIIIPEHILSNKHTILSKEEEEHLLNNVLLCNKHNLPKIKITDPQIIWSPGKIDNVVSITRYDDVSGISLYYRVIVP
jgi:DNA-directed RNA polymerase subunit H (RpoH/RPB5)